MPLHHVLTNTFRFKIRIQVLLSVVVISHSIQYSCIYSVLNQSNGARQVDDYSRRSLHVHQASTRQTEMLQDLCAIWRLVYISLICLCVSPDTQNVTVSVYVFLPTRSTSRSVFVCFSRHAARHSQWHPTGEKAVVPHISRTAAQSCLLLLLRNLIPP
jgi:hypothetical protein